MRFSRQSLVLLDALLIVAAFLIAFAIRVPFRFLDTELPRFLPLLPPLIFLRIAIFAMFGLYRPIWANAALRESVAVLAAVSFGSVVVILLLVFQAVAAEIASFPRLVLLIEWGLTLALVGGARYSLRVLDLRDLGADPEDDEQERHHRVLKEKLAQWLYDAPWDVQRLWDESQRWSFRRVAKRTFDILVSLFALVLFAVPLLIIAVLVKLETPGPVLADTPKRAGRGGTEFRMYKFRGMFENAHMMLVNNPQLWEKYKKNNFKLGDDDPRLTRVGRFIRRTSLDELPNFINVLHGEMSIVGPRARYPFEVVAQAERFPETQPEIIRILSVKPGVTGPWQVAGRSRLGYEERTHLEARYAECNSLLHDIIICLKTIPIVLKKEGAH